MYLNQIEFRLVRKNTTKEKTFLFRQSCHYVKEIFLALLPKRFYLDGSSKLAIVCGDRGTDPMYRSILGVAVYYHEQFDLESHLSLSMHDKEQYLINLTRTTCHDIYRINNHHGNEPEMVNTVLDTIVANDFSVKIRSKKLSTSIREHKLFIDVFRNINRNVGELWTVEIRRGKNMMIEVVNMHNSPSYMVWTDRYKKSAILDNIFTIYDNLGYVTFTMDITKYLS